MSKISKRRLEEILSNLFEWGLNHDDEFMKCMIAASRLTLEEAKDLEVEEYHEDNEQADEEEEDISPKRVAELKDLFQTLARDARECDELEDWLQSYASGGDITYAEYDYIVEHWDEWLPEED